MVAGFSSLLSNFIVEKSRRVLMDVLTGEQVKLTALHESDLETILPWFDDTEFSHLFDAMPATPRSKSQLTKWFEEFSDSNTQYLFAIRNIHTNALIGYIELDGILWNNRVCWIAIAIGGKDHRGKGYGYESMKLALDFAFYELNLNRVQLTVFDYNVPALSLYKKLGFQQEGIYREFLQRHGKTYDMLLFGLLKKEWKTRTEINENLAKKS